MDEFTSITVHEAAHAVVALLEEEHVGSPQLISALPDGSSLGRVESARQSLISSMKDPRTRRAIGRRVVAGSVAEALAGGQSYLTHGGDDARKLARLDLLFDLGDRFLEESIAGAEFMLRTHWGAVEGIAGLLTRIGVLIEPHGIALARAELARKPMRQLVPDFEGLARLLVALQHVPEFGESFKRELRAMLPPAAPAKTVCPPGARSRLLSRSQPRSFRRVSGGAIG
jgi:hypothetical protein